jgi:tetratricopeptide (TPR) repeat protein
VTYVMQRFASLVTFFYLLSLVAYIKSRLTAEGEWQKGKGKLRSIFRLRAPIVWFYSVALISAVLAMKTKENAFTLPLIITLYEFCFFSVPEGLPTAGPLKAPRLPTFSRRQRLFYLFPILLTLLIMPLTFMSIGGSLQLDPRSYGHIYPQPEYFFTEFRVLVTYLRLLFFPVNQNLDYDYPAFESFFAPQVMLSFLFLAALFTCGVYLLFTRSNSERSTFNAGRLMGFGILWFFITISVESSVIPLWMLICEYRVYLPSVGVAIAVVTGAFMLKERLGASRQPAVGPQKAGRVLVGMLALMLAALSVAAYQRNDLWADSIRLWEDTARKSPDKARPHYNLGVNYLNLKMFDKAIEHYQIALKLAPDYAAAHDDLEVAKSLNTANAYFKLAISYQTRNLPDKALEQYLAAIRLNPDFVEAHYNLGVIYEDSNMPDKAIEQYLAAIRLNPNFVEAHYNLGVIYETLNMTDKALEQYQAAINLKPTDAEAHINLGTLYYKMGETANARIELTAGLKIKPDNRQARQLLNQVIGEKQ